MDLKQKIAVITGGGSGIGRGIAIVLANAGARVVICGRQQETLDETLSLLQKSGSSGRAITCDVTSPNQLNSLFNQVAEKWKQVDVLVNNAGAGGSNPINDSGKRWRSILATNLDGPFHCTRAALPWIPEGGRIVNISSILGRFGVPGYTAYCSSKHGLIGFTRALALELAPRRITVNAVCPGWVETEMARLGMEEGAKETGMEYGEYRRRALNNVPLKEIVQPHEVGELVCFLASDGARNITGQSYNLCGGQIMS